MIKGAGTRELKTPKQTLFKPGMQPDGRLVDLPGGNKKGMNLAFAEALGTAAEKGKFMVLNMQNKLQIWQDLQQNLQD